MEKRVNAGMMLLKVPAPKDAAYCSMLKYQWISLLRKKENRIARGKKHPRAAERGFLGFQRASVMVTKASAPQKIITEDQ